MAVPFLEVIIHTLIDVLRHKAEDLEKDEKVAVYANLIKLSLHMSHSDMDQNRRPFKCKRRSQYPQNAESWKRQS